MIGVFPDTSEDPAVASSRLTGSALEEEIAFSNAVSESETSMFYLLQLVRIFPSAVLRRSVLLAMSHPLSQEARSILMLHMQSNGKSIAESRDRNTIMNLPESFNLSPNIFREGVKFSLRSCHQKLASLTVYVVQSALHGLMQDYRNGDAQSGPLCFEAYLRAINFLPPDTLSEGMFWASAAAAEESTVDYSSDLYRTQDLVSMAQLLQTKSHTEDTFPVDGFFAEFKEILKMPQNHCIAMLQVLSR